MLFFEMLKQKHKRGDLISNDVTVWEEKFTVSHTVPERSQLPLFGKHVIV